MERAPFPSSVAHPAATDDRDRPMAEETETSGAIFSGPRPSPRTILKTHTNFTPRQAPEPLKLELAGSGPG
eukprot:scaffold95117_cov38-Tisochrysis_lutea.AAC.1